MHLTQSYSVEHGQKGVSFMGGKKNVTVFLVLGILFFASVGDVMGGTLQHVTARGKLIAGVRTDFPPMGFVDKEGMNRGLDVDIAKFLSKRLFGNEEAVDFITVTAGDRIHFLTSGKVDILLASMTITEERKKVIDFSTPYFISGLLILVPENSRIKKYQDLAGKKVATIVGTTGDKAIKELVPTAERIRFQRNPEALKALLDRQVDAFVQDDVLLIEMEEKSPKLKRANWKPFRPAYYGLGVRKGDEEWLNFVNASLRDLKKSGEYEKLLEKWFGKARALLLRVE
jgi:ABC-type amino acid transport substrate-binding protein